MKRTTILLPDDVAKLVQLEAARRGVTPSTVLREAVSQYVAPAAGNRGVLRIAGIFQSGQADTSERVDELLATLATDTAADSGL